MKLMPLVPNMVELEVEVHYYYYYYLHCPSFYYLQEDEEERGNEDAIYQLQRESRMGDDESIDNDVVGVGCASNWADLEGDRDKDRTSVVGVAVVADAVIQNADTDVDYRSYADDDDRYL